MAAAVGWGESAVGKTLVKALAVLAAVALASIVGRALANSGAAWSRLGRLAVCDTSGDSGDLATVA